MHCGIRSRIVRILNNILFGFCIIGLICFTRILSANTESPSVKQPLLQPGKNGVFQRVLTTPSCLLSDSPGILGEQIPAFSRFYIYDVQSLEGETWLNVGPDSYGRVVGWVNKNCTVDWKIQLSLALTNPAGREPLLFYQNKSTLEALYDSEDPKSVLAPIYEALEKGTIPESIVAKEPETMIDQSTQFYLLPVLDSDEIFTQEGFRTRLLNVASVSKANIAKEGTTSSENTQTSEEVTAQPNSLMPLLQNIKSSGVVEEAEISSNRLKGFSASVVFVIDSTISMGPYIDKTKQVVNKIYGEIEQANLLEQVKFGLVSFRSNIDAVPKLEWTAKMFANPNEINNGKDFLSQISGLKEATVSSSLFDEDPYAGVLMALESIDWNEFGARYIVLVTDAGAIEGDNALSSTGLDAAQVRQEAKRRGVALYTLHLKTQSGVKNHDKAQAQYNELSFNDYINKALYYPIGLGDVNEFGQKIESLAKAITSQINLAYQGENAVGSATNADDEIQVNEKNETSESKTETDLLEDTQKLGHAMQLAYLGKVEGTQAPPVFQAWISDRDILNQSIPTVEVQVLLTKSELSDMSDVLKKVVDAANEGLISPESMFQNLRDLAATMGTDPGLLKQTEGQSLQELGLLGEYLEDLPYLSEVLSLDEETWKSWDGLEQEKFIRRLNTKINYYQKYNDDVDRWIALAPDSDPRDHVYPVPLENLP